MNQTADTNPSSSEFDQLLSESLSSSNLKEGSIIKGIISEIEDDAVVVDVGGKTEGRIPKREFIFLKDKKNLRLAMRLMFI